MNRHDIVNEGVATIKDVKPLTATKLAILNKQYWDNFNYSHPDILSPLIDSLYLLIIKHYYIDTYFAKWGWK